MLLAVSNLKMPQALPKAPHMEILKLVKSAAKNVKIWHSSEIINCLLYNIPYLWRVFYVHHSDFYFNEENLFDIDKMKVLEAMKNIVKK